MPSETMTIDQLELSAHNVRTNRQDQMATDAIERSLLASGQMFPLLVHPMKGRKDRWGVFAGGRRWRSFKNLIERGELPRDHPIEVVVRDLADVQLTELSLAENLLRRDLRPYEEYAAVLKAQQRGAAPDEIARAIGQEPVWVKRALRLATLAPRLLAALETGRLSVDQAQAFGSTEDQGAQLAAWAALIGTGDAVASGTTAAQIRAQLKVGDAELERLLKFVGDDAYRDAGGQFELDLFAEQPQQRGRVTDEALLRGLVATKLDTVRAEQRALAGRDVRFQAKPPQTSYGTTDASLQIEPEYFDNGPLILPSGDVLGTIDITPAGEVSVRWWWASTAARSAAARKAKGEGKPVKAATPVAPRTGAPIAAGEALGQTFWGERQRADGAIKEETGLTADGVQVMRSLRRAVLRAALVDDAQIGGTLAADYLVWAQLRMHLSAAGRNGMAESAAEVGMQRLHSADADGEPARPHVDDSNAGRTWRQALALLKNKPFLTAPDLVDAFGAYRQADPRLKQLAAGVAATLALERSLDADGYRIPVHEAIAVGLGLDRPDAVRRYWQPTAAFLELLPIADRRAVAEPFLEPNAFAGWTKLKGAELTPLVLRVVEGTAPSTRTDQRAAAGRWLHPLLRFAGLQAEPQPDVMGFELAEAAE